MYSNIFFSKFQLLIEVEGEKNFIPHGVHPTFGVHFAVLTLILNCLCLYLKTTYFVYTASKCRKLAKSKHTSCACCMYLSYEYASFTMASFFHDNGGLGGVVDFKIYMGERDDLESRMNPIQNRRIMST